MQFHQVNLTELVARIQGELQADEDGRRTQREIGKLPEVEGDQSLLHQVLVNLLSNAVKYSRKASSPRIIVGSRNEKDSVTVFVKDNGAGFEMQYVNKLFNVFQRLHRATEFEGTGIGLAIVRRIVERHGGQCGPKEVLVKAQLFTANEIVVVHDGAEALDFLYRRGQFSDRNPADPLVVLLDIKMPKVSGLEVLQHMKADPQLRMVPVVMLTSSREGPDV